MGRIIYAVIFSLAIGGAIIGMALPPPQGVTLEQLRTQYTQQIAALKIQEAQYRQMHWSECAIAERLSLQRRVIGEEYKNATPAVFRSVIYERNLKKYGDKLGPTFVWLQQHGESCAQIISSAETASGSDLGLKSSFLPLISSFYTLCEHLHACAVITMPK